MRVFLFSLALVVCVDLPAQQPAVKAILCNHAWQENHTSVIWTFSDSGNFSAILFCLNPKEGKSGFTLKKGIFSVTDSGKILHINLDSTYQVYARDSTTSAKDSGWQDWQLVNITDNRIVLKRPPVWPSEHRLAGSDHKLTVTWKNEKKSKGSLLNR